MTLERDFEVFDALNRAITRLCLISHAPAMTLGRSVRSSDEDIGGKRPTGGINGQDDREADFRQKSVEHFRARIARCDTPEAARSLLVEVEDTIWAWTHTPDVDGIKELEPEHGSFLWKCNIADNDREHVRDIARRLGIGEATVYRYRAKYRGLRAPKRAA